MRDKERILTHIISKIYPNYILGMKPEFKFSDLIDENIKVGDLVYAVTSGLHEFKIGYVNSIKDHSSMVIREIGSKRACSISNEMWYKIPLDILYQNELLEGIEYKIYKMVLKSLKDSYAKRFHSISFEDGLCTVNLRLIFDNEILKTYTFNYSKQTTLKEIISVTEAAIKWKFGLIKNYL